MSDITREALAGMGFEFAHQNYAFMKVGEIVLELWFDYDSPKFDGVILRFPSGCQHIHKPNDLPALRRLIRSLFGDDALPRRKLSSITDEECRHIVGMAFDNFVEFSHEFFLNEDMFLIGHTKHKDSDKLYICIKVPTYIRGEYLETTEKSIAVWSDGVVVGVQSAYTVLEIQSYLTKVCDFHLPAFHDDKGGEQ